MKGHWPITLMCEVLEVSASGYFHWADSRRDGDGGPRRFISDEAVLAHIRALHAGAAR
jgi:putative transposase